MDLDHSDMAVEVTEGVEVRTCQGSLPRSIVAAGIAHAGLEAWLRQTPNLQLWPHARILGGEDPPKPVREGDLPFGRKPKGARLYARASECQTSQVGYDLL
jgi:hypothetical protein